MLITQLNDRRPAVKRRRRHRHHITSPRPFPIREHMHKQTLVEFFALPDAGTSRFLFQLCHASTVTFWPRANVSASKAASASIRWERNVPGPSAFEAAISPARPKAARAAVAAFQASASTARKAATTVV